MDWTFVRLLMAFFLETAMVWQCHAYTTSSPPHSAGLVALSQTRAISAEEEDPRCRNFTIGLPHRQEFYSPGYPGSYPAKIDCILILEADYGQVIRVDFRDQFDLEPHDGCIYDFLEVRDGAHGYSPLVDRYCGRLFPPVITSSERHLWLRFSSDDNIEYTGFRAVYQFLIDTRPTRPDLGPCRFQVQDMLDGTFGRNDIPDEMVQYSRDYQVPLDCTWTVTVAETQKIQLSFPAYSLVAANECDLNYIEIFGEKTDLQHRLKHFCGSAVEVVLSKGNVIHLRFFAQPVAIRSTFEVLFTAVTLYRETEGLAKCNASEFDCEDAVCIDNSLRCNGRLNCKFRYDEENCKIVHKKAISSDHIIIILTILSVTIFGLCFGCFYKCFLKLRADHHVYQTRRSRSREDRLDMDDETPPRRSHNKPLPDPQFPPAPASNKSRPTMAGTTSEDTLDDVFQQRSRLRTSTSRSLSIMANGFADSIVNVERYPSAAADAAAGKGKNPPLVAADSVTTHDSDGEEEGDDEEEEEEEDMVEMVDSSCQTRESLFDQPSLITAASTPPPPPTTSYPVFRTRTAVQPTTMATTATQPDRFKAERTIDIASSSSQSTAPQQPGLRRGNAAAANRPPAPPRAPSSSVASSKSGADVVVLH